MPRAAEPSNANDGKTHVVASFYPFAYVAEQVGGSFVDVQNLTSPGVEPHDLELKPKQVGAVQDADLVIFETHFQAAVDQAVKQADRPTKTVDVSRSSSSRRPPPSARGRARPRRRGHDHGDEDPHIWLDPVNMLKITRPWSQADAADPTTPTRTPPTAPS